MTHIVDSLEKVPPEFRDSVKTGTDSRRGSLTIEPSNPVVPGKSAPSGAAPAVADPAAPKGSDKAGAKGPDYAVARIRVNGSEESLGSWQSSRVEFRGNPYYVVVAASWCPHCMELFKELNSKPKLKGKIAGVLFYENEAESAAKKHGGSAGENHLTDPDELPKFSLPFYLIRKNQFDKIVSGYPSMLECASDGCKRISAWDWVEENK